MASLFRNSRSIITQISCIRRTAATVVASNSGTQVKTSGSTANVSQGSHSADGGNLAVRDARRKLTPADPIKPRPVRETPFLPLVGTALNVWGQIGIGIVLTISAYFIYINYITNPEFYKSIKLSREASSKESHEHSANHGSGGHKTNDANASKGESNKH